MSPEAQRIAIAGACGWEGVDPVNWAADRQDGSGYGTVPDYLSDLNAMHEAIESQHHNLQAAYAVELCEMIGGVPGCYSHIEATAAQRAEVFLRTLNLWDDSK